jgi:hypothetical protein
VIETPGIFYEHGYGYVLCGWPSRMSIKALKAAVKESAPDTRLIRQQMEVPVPLGGTLFGRSFTGTKLAGSKLFYMEGPKEQVDDVGQAAFELRLEWLRRHKDVG